MQHTGVNEYGSCEWYICIHDALTYTDIGQLVLHFRVL